MNLTSIDFPLGLSVTYVYPSECGYNRKGELGEYKMTLTDERVARIGLRAAQRKVIGFRRWANRFDRELTRRVNAEIRSMQQSEKAIEKALRGKGVA